LYFVCNCSSETVIIKATDPEVEEDREEYLVKTGIFIDVHPSFFAVIDEYPPLVDKGLSAESNYLFSF